MSNLSVGLCGKLAKGVSWSTFAPLDSILQYPLDKVIHSLNN